MPIEKPAPKDGSVSGDSTPVGGMMGKSYPNVLEYLSLEKYSNGDARERATLMVIVENGVVKLLLNDRDTGNTAWVSGETLEEALKALEARLAKGTLEWRKGQRGGKKGK